jgi:P-type E1-E2 ATPase
LRDHEVIALAASLEHASEHPLAKAIGDFAQLTSITLKEVSHFKAYKGCGVKGTIEGITYFIGSDSFIKDIAPIDQSLLERKETRILTPIILARYHQVLGYFFVGDVIKEGASQAIAALKNFGIKAHMATGDHSHAAAYVAQAVGIDSYPARMMPEDKQNLVYTLKARGAQVAVAGDGINDAPALAAADVGIAMSTGTDLAIETADLTLLHGDIRKIVKAYQLSRDTLKVIRQNLFWAFAFNGLGIPLAAGLFYPFGITLNPAFAGAAMAFSSLMVVGNAARFRFSP